MGVSRHRLDLALEEVIQVGTSRSDDLRKFFKNQMRPTQSTQSVFRSPQSTDREVALANFVFQGGGVLGIAHLGFLRGLEEIGVRAAGVAGTSAGAILALLIAASRRSSFLEPVADPLTDVLWRMPTSSFVDGPYASRRLIKGTIGRKRSAGLELVVPAISSIRRLLRTYGLNPGTVFEEWLTRTLRDEHEVTSVSQLVARVADCAKSSGVDSDTDRLLQLIATALPLSGGSASQVGVKITFPRDAEVLARRYQSMSPALFARASMSVPIFFEPLVCDLNRTNWSAMLKEKFQSTLHPRVQEELMRADSIAFVDGGLLSNFPIDAFLERSRFRDDPEQPTRIESMATIGVTLTSAARVRAPRRGRGISQAAAHVAAMIDAMRGVRDRDAIEIASLSRKIDALSDVAIAPVDVGPHHWLNFDLSPDEKQDLFLRGIADAADFLRSV